MTVMMTARIWSGRDAEEDMIEADNVGAVINLAQGDQCISLMDGEHAKSMIEAIMAYAVLMGWNMEGVE